MLWLKRKYELRLHGGSGNFSTGDMFGMIQHLIVIPESPETVWSMIIKDKDQDIVYETIDHVGRLDDKQILPVGGDKPDKLFGKIYDSTSNEKFEIIFKVREAM